MRKHTPVKVTGRTRELVIRVDKAIYRFTYHWVAFFNVLLLLFVTPIFLAPVLMASGHEALGRALYVIYRPTCHQLPERSFFLQGESLAYDWDELVEAGMDPASTPFERQRFLGTAQLGYKMLVCQRDAVIYAGLLLAGMLYGLLGRRLKPLPFWGFVLFVAPMAIDGVTQAAGLRSSTPLWRIVTGLCVALGSIWFAYPYIEAAMVDLRHDIARKLHLNSTSD
jgi:uncharacterized membrane protein